MSGWEKEQRYHGHKRHHFPWGLRGDLFGKNFLRPSRLFKYLRRNLFVDREETEDEHLIKIEVPGVERDKITAKASEGNLTVEIDGEPYYYTLPPNVKREEIYASLKLGILTVHMPKKEPDRNVSID